MFRSTNPVKYVFARAKILLAAGLLMLGACNAPMPDLDLKPQLDGLFMALGQGDIDKAMTFYPDEFFKAYSREFWRDHLVKFNQTMGTIENYRIRNKQSDTRFSGKFFVYQLETIHPDNKKASHIVTFVLPVDGSNVKLVGHKITAKGFY